MATLIIEIRFPEPGGGELAAHLREPWSLAFLTCLPTCPTVSATGLTSQAKWSRTGKGGSKCNMTPVE
jgi:hypothetical protein